MINKKKAFLCFLFSFSSLSAHDFWVDSNNEAKLKATLGYGHDFPAPEKIAENRLDIFEPIKVQGKNYSKVLKNEGENYEYVLKDSLKKGSYIVSSVYKPTYWTKDVEHNWHVNKRKDQIKLKANRCLKAKVEAKSFVNIQNSSDKFYKTALGHSLEIIPLDNPANLKVGVPFKLQVLYKGKPLKIKPVKGTVEGFVKNKFAYYGNTDLRGVTEVIALKEGKWVFKVNVKNEYANKEHCDEETFDASITLDVKK